MTTDFLERPDNEIYDKNKTANHSPKHNGNSFSNKV